MTVGKEADRRRRKPEEGKEGKKRKSKRDKERKRAQKQEAGVGAARAVNGQQCLARNYRR